MTNIFHYSTLDVHLIKETRTLNIAFKENISCLGMETLFELESLFAWATTRVEIRSIFIESRSAFFSLGYDKEFLPKMSGQALKKMTDKLQKIVYAMFHPPQTIIIDMQEGTHNIASELAIGADIRISNVNVAVSFDHMKYGLVPSSGGMGFLSEIVGQAMARNWLLTGRRISRQQLLNSGFIAETYDSTNRKDCITNLLKSIYEQAPVQRIQAKLGLYESIKEPLERAVKFEKSISKAAMVTEDWKEKASEKRMPAKSMSYSVKLSLVKDNEGESDLSH